MTDQVVETNEKQDASAKNGAKINYVLYLASIILGITGLIALIMAYVNKKDAPEWVQTHYQFQIRTFWIGLLYAVIGGILTFVGIGLLILLFYVVWLIVRCVKGLKALDKNEPIENPTSWMF
ncbi:DUF4870 family protein [Pseudoalteromonas sp.]|uniref:DUF4870 family protein n=1 Tax=Pseudoalteromonas sp. TaxID=53249 RepID=UPI003564AD0E